MPKRNVVLVAATDPAVRLHLNEQFASLRIACDFADNGSQAIAMARDGYGVILMDITSPDLNGSLTTMHIREQECREKRQRTPIIAIINSHESQEYITAGMDGILQMPVAVAQLKSTVYQWLPSYFMTDKG